MGHLEFERLKRRVPPAGIFWPKEYGADLLHDNAEILAAVWDFLVGYAVGFAQKGAYFAARCRAVSVW
jgi:hypothetical protein